MSQPLPCPFCGSANIAFTWQAPGLSGKLVFMCVCLDCKARGPERGNCEDSVAAWNMEQEKREVCQ